MEHMQPVRARLSRRREVRARVGVLEGVRGRPEMDATRIFAMTHLGNGLSNAERHEDALSVKEAELAMMRRVGASEEERLIVKGNLAIHVLYARAAREAMQMKRGRIQWKFEAQWRRTWKYPHGSQQLRDLTLHLFSGRRSRGDRCCAKPIPVARRALGDNHEMRSR